MCGIMGYVGPQEAAPILVDGLKPDEPVLWPGDIDDLLPAVGAVGADLHDTFVDRVETGTGLPLHEQHVTGFERYRMHRVGEHALEFGLVEIVCRPYVLERALTVTASHRKPGLINVDQLFL